MQEAKRVFNLKIVAFGLLLLFINALILVSGSRSDAALSQTYGEMVRLASVYKEAGDTWQDAATLAWNAYFTEHELVGQTETQEVLTARKARQLLMDNARYVDGFAALLQSKMDRALQIAGSGIYETDSFEYTNLLKTRYDLSALTGLEVSLGNGIWLEKLYNHRYIQIFVLLLLFAVVYSFFAERKTGLYYIIHAAKDGRGRLFFKRVLTLLAGSALINLIFYAESALLLLHIHGGVENIHQPAAGDQLFVLTSGTLTRLEFFGWVILAATTAATVLSLLLWCLLSCFRNTNIGMAVYLVLLAADLLLYMWISPKSVVRALRFINVYYLLFPGKALEYYNWGYSFGITSLTESTTVLALGLGIGLLFYSLHLSIHTYFTGKANPIEIAAGRMMEMFLRLLRHVPGLCKEIYKILISQKAIIVLLPLFYICYNIQTGSGVLYDPVKSSMFKYYERANGLSYGDELEAIYAEYEAEFENLKANLDYSMETADTILRNRQELLGMMRANVDYVKKMNEQGVSAVVMLPYEYEEALGSREGSNQRLLALLNVLAMLVISCGYISYEKKNQMHRLVLTCSGRRKWLWRKILANWLLILLFMGITYVSYYYRLSRAYAFDNLSAPLKSLPMFQNYPINPTVLGFFIIDMIVKFVLLASLSAVMCFISMHIKYLYSLLAGMLLAVPQFLSMLGFEVLDHIAIGKYVAVLPCLLEGKGEFGIGVVFMILLTALGAVLYFYMIKEETRNG